MKVIIGCEYSGTVRDAFLARGHDAMSCDILPTEKPGPHYQGDVRDVLGDGWDLGIFHPPCTRLSLSGARWWPQYQEEQTAAIAFFMELAGAELPRLAVENPVGIMSTYWRKPDQIIHPWQFGHGEKKRTCLWLKNCPPPTANSDRHRPGVADSSHGSWTESLAGAEPHLSGMGRRHGGTVGRS